MADLKFTCKDNVLTINFEGRIDSTNAPKIGDDVNEIKSANAHDAVIIDADKLEYISSAGLRVILGLIKTEKNLKIINVSSDVYEVFDMTGFSEMTTIEKGYRHISVEGCEVIGQGSNGIVYRTDPDTIVKVYKNPDSLPEIENERKLARSAFVKGIPTAIPFDIVKVGNTYGSVFELLNAKSFIKLVNTEPDNIDKYIQLSVDLLKKIHAAEVSPEEMPSIKETAIKWGNFFENILDKDAYKKLMDLIEAVPENNHMMHGDFHFKNIMMQNGEVLLIDMDTLCHGNPIFEFAAIYNAYLGFGELNHDDVESFLGIKFEQAAYIWNKTIELYFGTTDKAKLEEITNKSKLIGYVRIARRTMKRKLDSTDSGKAVVKYCLDEINKLLPTIDSLAL